MKAIMIKMKRTKMLVYATALLLTACAASDTAEQVPWAGSADVERRLVSFTASEAGVTAAAGTRAETDIQTALFDADEVLQGYLTHNLATPRSFSPLLTTLTPAGDRNPLQANQLLYWPEDPTKTISVYALYPQTVTSGTASFSVLADQTTDENYKASDLMWGGDHTANAALTVPYDDANTAVNIPFRHKMAKLIVNAVTDGSVTGIVVNGITVKGVKRQIDFSPTTGLLGAAGTLADAGDIAMTNGGACLLPPQTIAAGAAFVEVAVTIGGTAYTAVYKTAGTMTLDEGHQYTLDVTVGSQALILTATITDWTSVLPYHTITPKEWGTLSMAAVTDDFTYDTTEKCPTPAVTTAGNATPLVSGTDFDYSYYANVNAGTNTALVVATGRSGTDYAGQVAVRKFSIAKATPTVTPPEAADVTYNGAKSSAATAQALLASTGSTDYGTMFWSLNGTSWYEASEVAAQITGTDAGGYTVYYKVVGDANINDVDAASIPATVNKKTITDWSLSQTTLMTLKTGDGDDHEKTVTIDLGDVYSDDFGTVTVNNGSSTLTSSSNPVGASVSVKTITMTGNQATTSDQTITVTIADGSNYTFSGSQSFTAKVETDDPGVALANSQVGYKVGSNGKAYDPSWTMPSGVSVVGMVAYKSGTSGIVLAASDASSTYTWSNACSYASAGSFYVSDLSSTTDENWICGTKDQYTNCGVGSSSSWSTLQSRLSSASCNELSGSRYYWSSTVYGSYGAWGFQNGSWYGSDGRSYSLYVRPCFAF